MEESLKYRISLEDLFSPGISKAEHAGNRFEKSIEQIGERLGHFRTQLIEAFIGFEAIEFGKEAVSDFLSLEKAASQLQFTVGQRGGLTQDFKELTEESEKLGKTSFFNPREIQQAENQLLNFGISIKQTKESIQALTDVGLAKGKSLDEVIGAVSMAAAGGRAMALKEYGLGFIKLEKDMSVAGAEARNFNKIVEAMGDKFSGATEAMKNTEFFKIKKMQDDFEQFKESVGRNLLKIFDELLPYIRKAIEYLKELGRWIKENKSWVEALAVGVGTAMAAFTTIKVATEAWTFAQSALNIAMNANPIGLVITAVSVLTAGIYKLIDGLDEIQKRYAKQEENRVYNDFEKEIIATRELAKEYEKLGLSKEYARATAIVAETNKIDANIAWAKANETDTKALKTYVDEMEALKRNIQKGSFFDMKKKISESKEPKSDLGSGLSEPKASKIQNITININQPFQNQKVNMEAPSMDVKDIAPKFTEYLISLVEDAAIVAVE